MNKKNICLEASGGMYIHSEQQIEITSKINGDDKMYVSQTIAGR